MNALFLLVAAGLGQTLPLDRDPLTPETQVRACLRYICSRHEAHARVTGGEESRDPEVCFLRFVSWHGVPKAFAAEFKPWADFATNHVSTAQNPLRWAEVPGAVSGTLYMIDYRSPNWTRRGVSAVWRRDHHFREPLISTTATNALRVELNIEQDVKGFTAEGIMWAPTLLRSIIETDRDFTYYDLLYGEQRFPGGKREWPGGDYEGKNYRGGAFQVWDKAGQEEKFVDFPADDKDFEKFWGVADTKNFLETSKLEMRQGEIVAGFKTDPKIGSRVNYNDRAFIVTDVPGGWYGKTYDNLKTAGDRDYLEKPEEVFFDVIKADAHEYLRTMPNGFIACQLGNAAGKRQEFADARIVRNSSDPHSVTVLTPIGCMICHSPDLGFIPPTNSQFALNFNKKNGIKRRFISDKEEELVRGFFEGWGDKIEYYQFPFKRGLRKLTTTGKSGLGGAAEDTLYGKTGEWAADTTRKFRDWFDDLVSPDQAAAEVGVTLVELKVIFGGTTRRSLAALAQGRGVGRSVWENDGLPAAILLIDAARKDADPVRQALDPLYLKLLKEQDRKAIK